LVDKTCEIAQNSSPPGILDKGFCSKPVFKVLNQHKLSYVVPIPVRGRSGGVRSLFHGKSRETGYTFHSPKYGAYTVQAVVTKRYSKGAMDDTAASGLPTQWPGCPPG
jgi:hypothetical protein